MSVTETYRRWAPVIARLKTRLAARNGALSPKMEAAVNEAVTTYDSLLQALADAEMENHQLRSRIKAQDAEWDHLFGAIPMACLITDVSGTILGANNRAAELLNMSARHLVQRPLVYFIQEDRDGFIRMLRDLSLAQGDGKALVRIKPRERAPLKIDLAALPLVADHANRWFWFLEPSSADLAKRAALLKPSAMP